MPVYNGEKYLEKAIESILTQTFRDFEFIIIDDGSTDDTSDILARYQQKDARIRVYHQKNQGLMASLNRGCQLAQGKYIARMDADDVSLPERLEQQVRFLDTRPDIGILGTWMEVIDKNGVTRYIVRVPTTPALIEWSLLFDSCMGHPSVMMRRDVIERLNFYSSEATYAEDYDLWSRASLITHLANIPEALLRYRVWEGGLTSHRLLETRQYADIVSRSVIIRLLGSEVSSGTIGNLRKVLNGLPLDSSQQIDEVVTLVKQLHRTYLNTHSLNRAETREIAHDAGMRLLTIAASTGKVGVLKRLCIVAQALRLSPRLFGSKLVITKGLKKGFHILSGMAYGRY
ncbi:MAG: glycosyltransferase [Dehalococcoidia bacterium]|nr:glycosyltransferase [Dehalococcoidia bacterium]